MQLRIMHCVQYIFLMEKFFHSIYDNSAPFRDAFNTINLFLMCLGKHMLYPRNLYECF
jgi:hypothetical protein